MGHRSPPARNNASSRNLREGTGALRANSSALEGTAVARSATTTGSTHHESRIRNRSCWSQKHSSRVIKTSNPRPNNKLFRISSSHLVRLRMHVSGLLGLAAPCPHAVEPCCPVRRSPQKSQHCCVVKPWPKPLPASASSFPRLCKAGAAFWPPLGHCVATGSSV